MAIVSGSIVAMVTPWSGKRIRLMKLSCDDLVEFHIAMGTSAILPCGTTGESPSFTHEEQHRMIALTVEAAGWTGPGHCRRWFQQHPRSGVVGASRRARRC